MADINNSSINEFASLVEQINALANSAALSKASGEMRKWNDAVESLASSDLSKKLLRTDEQRTRAKMAGERDLFNMQIFYTSRLLDLQTRIADAKKSGDARSLSKLESEASIMEKQLGMVKDNLDYLQQIIGENDKLSKTDRTILENKVALASLDHQMQGQIGVDKAEQLKKEKEILIAREKTLNFARDMEEVDKRRNKLSEASDKIFGISRDDWKQKVKDAEAILTNPYLLIGTIFQFATTQLNELRKSAGAAYSQTIQLARVGGGGFLSALGTGTVATLGQTREAVGSLAREFGHMQALSASLVADQLKLTQVWGLSQEQAAHLLHTLDDVGGNSKDFASNTISFARALAKANQIPVGQLMEDMVKNSELLARYGSQGAQSFIKAAAAARQIGVELSDIDKFADTALNIETFLQGTMRLRTLGINLSNPTRLMQLAQQNDLGGLTRELQSQLGGTDFSKLGRIQQNALRDTLGLSGEAITRLVHGGQFGTEIKSPTEKDFGGERMDNLLATLSNLSSNLKGLVGVLAFAVAAKGIGGMLGGGGLGGGLGGLLGGAGSLLKGAGAIGGGLALGAGAFDVGKTALSGGNVMDAIGRHKFAGLGALLGSFVPGVGTLLGAGVGGIADMLFSSSATEQSPASPTGVPSAPSQSSPITVAVDTHGIEMRLDDLIGMFRSGVISVNLDGKKVGNLIARAYPRAV